MKKDFLVFSIFLICFNFCFSQTIRFNKIYDLYGTADFGTSVIVEDDGYFVTGTTYSDSGSNQKLAMMKTDLYGNIVWRINYSVPLRNYYDDSYPDVFIKTSDGNYVFSGSLSSPNGLDVVLIKFNMNGDTLWQKTYGNTVLDWYGYQCKETFDKGIIIVGCQNVTANNSDLLLIKTDSLGNFKWKKNINFTQEAGTTIICTPDSGFLIGGTKQNGSYNYGWIVKTDSLGNLKWQKTISGLYGSTVLNITKTNDNNYVAVGWIGDSTNISFDFSRAFAIKINPVNGQTIWQRSYGNLGVGSGLLSIKNLPDESFISSGVQGSDPQHQYQTNAYVLKIAANGDSIFSRIYDKYSGAASTDALITICPTNDSGYIAVGGFFHNPQDFWLVKMDSLGCDTVGCQLNEIIESGLPSKEISIFPNPANNEITVNYNNSISVLITIYDLNGRLVKQIKTINTETVIDISDLQQGIYGIRVVGENIFWTEKIVKL